MEVNDDWRNSIKPYQGIDMPGMFADVELRAIRDEADEEDLWMKARTDRSGHVCFPNTSATIYFSDDKERFRRDAVVVGIDGRDVSGLDLEAVKEVLLKGHSTPTKLRLMTMWVADIFLNPALAIDLGLTEVLRFLVEDVGIDVNSQHYRGVVFFCRMPLIAHALVHPDPSSFQYLLSVSGLNANPVLSEFTGYIENVITLLHALKSERIEYALGDTPLDVTRIESLLMRDEVDVDALDDDNNTPLSCLVEWLDPREAPYSRTDLLLAKAFLDAGASTDHVDLSFIPNREGYNGKMLALLEAKDRGERDEISAGLDRPKRKRDDRDG